MMYSYDYSVASSVVSTVLMGGSLFIVLYSIIGIAGYVLKGIGFYTIAKDQGMENPWLAFVPFARKYQQGQIAGDITLKTKTIRKTGIWFMAMPIAYGIISYVLSMISALAIAGKAVGYGISAWQGYYYDYEIIEEILEVVIVLVVFCGIIAAIYNIFYKLFVVLVDISIMCRFTEGNMPLVHAVLSALIPLYESICIYVLSRKIVKASYEKQEEYADAEYTQADPVPPVQESTVSFYGENIPTRGLLYGNTAQEPVNDTAATEEPEQAVNDETVPMEQVAVIEQSVNGEPEAEMAKEVVEEIKKTEE